MCNVTALAPTHFTSLFWSFPFMAGRWPTSGSRGVTHISCHHKNTIVGTGENRRTNEQTRTMLGVNQEQKEELCNTTCMCRLTLAWVTSENSTKQLECQHLLTRSSSLDPIFSTTVSGVDRICPWFHANSSADSPLCCPVANSCQLLCPTNSLSRPLTTSGYGEISGPKILCLVSCQNRQRNRLLGGPPI